MEKTLKLYNLFRCVAILGNLFYILWILYNGIDEGFSATIIQKVSYIGLIILLILNIILFYSKRNNKVLCPERTDYND